MPVKELAHRLTMAGTEVGDVAAVGGPWDNVYVGLVIRVEPHPNADRLSLATVDIGRETITAVCGAPNVAQGQKIAFAKIGARLMNAHTGKVETLKAARIRDVVSEGMVCSELELGLGQDHQGILVLDESAPLGTSLADYMGDAVLDLEITPNRPDCLSILGIAHEVGAIASQPVQEPPLDYPEEGDPIEDQVEIRILDPDLCYRYTASLIRGVTIGPSPQWMQERLTKAGQRPINNIVDITNYVMLEYGQPLHAFDYDLLKGRTILVRRAKGNERHTTLDGVDRTLDPPMLVIADLDRAVGLAGIMGGANTEMTEKTTSVLLESANFDPINTRRTAESLKLRSEASYRFERGLRPELAELGLRRATRLILELAGGAARGIIDVYPGKRELPPMKLTMARVKKVLGVELPPERVEGALNSMGFERASETPSSNDEPAIWVKIPYWRSDISLEDDLVEEVARSIGYEEIPVTPLSSPIPHPQPQPVRELREKVRDVLASCGMQEVISYSLTSLSALEKVEALSDGRMPLAVADPMSSEHQYLRTTLTSSLLDTYAANHRSQEAGLSLFELGRVYLPRDKTLPEERETLGGIVGGLRSPSSWLARDEVMDFFEAKALLDSLFQRLRIDATYTPTEDPILVRGRSASIRSGEATLGVVGEVRPEVLKRFDIDDAGVTLFQVDLEKLYQALPSTERQYRSVPRYPEATRDMALVLSEEIPSNTVLDIIQAHDLVESASVFDVFRGSAIGPGKKSLAYRILFRSPSGTLTAEQVAKAQEEILATLEKQLGARLR